MLKIPAVLNLQTNSRIFLAQFLLLRYHVSACYCQRALVGESGMIRTQMGKHSGWVMVTVYGAPCVNHPVNGNSTKKLGTLFIRATIGFSRTLLDGIAAETHYDSCSVYYT
jgi:hypothetical protein